MKLILSVDPIRFPLTGIGRYTLELAHHLTEIPAVDEVRFFSGADFVDELPQPASSGPNPVNATKRFLARNSLVVELHRKIADRRRRKNLAGTQGELYHGTNFYLPPVEGPAIVTFHDLSVLTMPQHHPIERVRYMEKEIRLSLQRASTIITDSEFVRQEVAEYFGWPLDRIKAVHLAGSKEFFPRNYGEIAPTLDELDLTVGGYALYAGTIEPRKNLERLLIAYGKMNPRLRQQYPLILAGFAGWNNTAIKKRIDDAMREGWARYLGYVPDTVLPHLFSGARLFVYPSLYEGFGLPVVEAMASGIPVVCSNSSSLPEVVGQAAATCDPGDVDELATLISRGLDDEEWRKNAIQLGFEQSQKFSWSRCAQETVVAYDQIMRAA